MPSFIVSYVKYVDYVSTKFGRLAMYGIFVMIGTLLLGAITRNILNFPLSWTVEMAQFTMTAYYIMGGAYSMQLNDHDSPNGTHP
jgi:TRAP-type C4-dicarboxylate transport system permease small subunit